MQYRRSIYRKRKIKTVVISSIVAFIVIFALFLVIGTMLHDKTQESQTQKNTGISSNEKDNSSLATARTVGAYALPLLEDGSKFSERLAKIPPTASAVFVNLNTKDGVLLYRSELSSKFSHITTHSDASALSDSVTNIEREGFYISAALYVPSFSEKNDLTKEIHLSTWTSVACEAIREGVGDVLLIAPSMDSDDIDRVCNMADSIHNTIEKSVVGIVLPSFVFEEEDMIAIVNKLSEHFNYISLDTTDYKTADDALTHVKDRIVAFQHYLLQYKMRVILPRSSDATVQQEYIDLAASYNIVNWQILP